MPNPLSARALPVWRSILFVPAVSDRFVDSALRQPADVLQIDLEDSVGPAQKDEARARVAGIAERFAQAGRDVIVRVNRPWRMLVRDLEAAVGPSVLAVSLPKVPDASFVLGVAEVLSELEFERGLPLGHTRIVAMVEDAQGLSAINDIAMAHPRMVGLIVGAEDLAVSMRMAVHEDGLTLPNLMAVIAARRAGILPLGFIGSVADYKDVEAFRARVERARRVGFEGAFCVHPSQVAVMNQAFAPAPAEVEHARAVVDAFEAQVGSGRAAFSFNGRMVDLPVVEQCRQVLQRAAAIEARA
ncbi:MAG: CoA ester lyase [Burkholderiales bacterium]|nr:CoA ester lyase [Burkholderiales bacterium]